MMIMKQFDYLITTKEHSSDIGTINYVDIDENLSPQFLEKKFTLTEGDVKKSILESFNRLSEKYDNDLNETMFSLKEVMKEEDELLRMRKVLSKILSASNMIATDGRIGPGNIALMSQETFDKLGIKDIPSIQITIDNDVDDIIVYRKNEVTQPGSNLIYNGDKFVILEIGFFPYKQFIKLKL